MADYIPSGILNMNQSDILKLMEQQYDQRAAEGGSNSGYYAGQFLNPARTAETGYNTPGEYYQIPGVNDPVVYDPSTGSISYAESTGVNDGGTNNQVAYYSPNDQGSFTQNNEWVDERGTGGWISRNFASLVKGAIAAMAGGELISVLGSGGGAGAGAGTGAGTGAAAGSGSLSALTPAQIATMEGAASGMVAPLDFSATLGAGASGAGAATGGAGLLSSLSTLSPEQIAVMQGSASSAVAPIDFAATLGAGEAAAGASGLSAAANAAGDAGAFESGFEASNVIADSAANGTLNALDAGAGLGLTAEQLKLAATAAGALVGGVSSATAPNSTTATEQKKLDPRMDSMLYGADGKSGLLSNIVNAGSQPQNAGMAAFGGSMSDYLKNYGQDTYNNAQQTANKLMGGNIAAPTMGAANMNSASVANTPGMNGATVNSAQINAPSQNSTDLSSAYNKMIYGDSAQNPYLTGAIQKGINQSNTAFGNMLKDQTSATQDLLGNIRGGAIASGQYGGSRQGIAEGNALDSFNTNMSRAASQYGQNNTDAAVTAQAGAYDAGQNRSLSAMGGLGAQQYGVATQNAGFNQQANLANQSSQNLANQNNYQGLLNTNLANAGYQQQANQTNSGYQQAANQNNLSSQLSTNTLNSNNQQAGITASQGLLNTANNVATNNDAYNLNKLGTVSGLLSPYTGLNSTQSSTTPQFKNTAGSIVGGASTALSLYNMYNKP